MESVDFQHVMMVSGAWALALGGVLVVAWALFWDRARGRKRCPRCWYDMSAAVVEEGRGLVCPECGAAARGEKVLKRTRRRWGVVWLVGVMALAAWWGPGAARRAWARGVIGLAPTTGLVVLVPVLEPRGEGPLFSVWADELRTRCEKGDMAGWQLEVMCASTLELHSRGRVPVGMEVVMRSVRAEWLLGSVVFEYGTDAGGAYQSYLEEPVHLMVAATPGMREIIVHVRAETVGGDCVCAFDRRLRVEAVEDVRDAVVPVVSEDVDARVHAALSCSFAGSAGSGPEGAEDGGYLLLVGLDTSGDRELAEMAFPLSAELRKDGETVAHYRVLLGGDHARREGMIRLEQDADGAGAVSRALPGDSSRWTLLIRGEPARGVEDALRERVWAGEVEVPVTDGREKAGE